MLSQPQSAVDKLGPSRHGRVARGQPMARRPSGPTAGAPGSLPERTATCPRTSDGTLHSLCHPRGARISALTNRKRNKGFSSKIYFIVSRGIEEG